MIRLGHIWRRQAKVTTSHFPSALDRVREMRDDTTWPPLTSPGSIHTRTERVSEAQQRITIPPLASERDHSQWARRKSFFDELVLDTFSRRTLTFVVGIAMALLLWLIFGE